MLHLNYQTYNMIIYLKEFILIKYLVALVMLFNMLVLSGCAAFQYNDVPLETSMPDVSQYEKKPSVYVNLFIYNGEPGGKTNLVNYNDEDMKFIAGVVKKSNLFSAVGYALEHEKRAAELLSEEETDYTINIKVYGHSNDVLAALSGFVTGFTLGIVPGGVTNHFDVDVKCYDRKNRAIASYENHDRVQLLIGLWFIPFIYYTPSKAIKGTLENQIIASLVKMFEDGKLKYSFEDTNRISLPRSSMKTFHTTK